MTENTLKICEFETFLFCISGWRQTAIASERVDKCALKCSSLKILETVVSSAHIYNFWCYQLLNHSHATGTLWFMSTMYSVKWKTLQKLKYFMQNINMVQYVKNSDQTFAFIWSEKWDKRNVCCHSRCWIQRFSIRTVFLVKRWALCLMPNTYSTHPSEATQEREFLASHLCDIKILIAFSCWCSGFVYCSSRFSV